MVKPVPRNQEIRPFPASGSEIEWRIDAAPVPYGDAVDEMTRRVDSIAASDAGECIWLLEHPPLYTAGTSAQDIDLLDRHRFPVYRTGRGGQYTYHGPGQRVVYAMLDLKQRKRDVRAFVCALEDWIIATLADFEIIGERRLGRVGVWVRRPDLGPGHEDKIAAIGVRVRRWVTFHGLSINVNPDLEHFSGIVPCGVSGHGVTSLADLGVTATMADVDERLKNRFEQIFGATR